MLSFEPILCVDSSRCNYAHPKHGLCVWGANHRGSHRFCYPGQPDSAPRHLEKMCKIIYDLAYRDYYSFGEVSQKLEPGQVLVNLKYDSTFKDKFYSDRVGIFRGYARRLDVIYESNPSEIIEGFDGRILGWQYPVIYRVDPLK